MPGNPDEDDDLMFEGDPDAVEKAINDEQDRIYPPEKED
jgi:hypothetical protein